MVKEKQRSFKFKAKPLINKNNKQVSIVLPKRKLKKMNSDIKFDKDLFVELRIFREGKKNGN